MNKAKKHRTDKRKRTRMTVRAFCQCATPYYCVEICAGDEIDLYVQMDDNHGAMNDSVFSHN